MSDYEAFIESKSQQAQAVGFEAHELPEWMFPHQAALTKWALRKGRAAVFADAGLGKTSVELVWCQNVVKQTGGRTLLLAPLAVAQQIEDEGALRGIPCKFMREDDGKTPITIANYDMLHAFDPRGFSGVACDESGILKSYSGATRTALIQAFSATPYRLCATATPAPNDFTELGNHSEFLGIKSRSEMLAEYFTRDSGSTQDWRVKGHAQGHFWRWVASWGAVVKSPTDLGFDGAAYVLPELRMHETLVEEDDEDARTQGMLFAVEARTLQEQQRVRRSTLEKRVAEAARIAAGNDQCIVWVELNDEGDACTKAIDGAVQVRGSDDPDEKAEKLHAFAKGAIRVLVTKPSIAGHGLNFQSCNRMVFVGASNSYEQTYQAIRRCWRFGQKRPVDVHVVRADTERLVMENYKRKEIDAERMAKVLRAMVGDHVMAEVVGRSAREWNTYEARKKMALPDWLTGAAS